MEYTFGKFGPEHLKKVKSGVECFNRQEYWECHEELEHVWMEDRNDSARLVYWAIIQAAASLIHYRDGKIIGAQGMILKAQDKIKRCHTSDVLTDLVYKYLDWKEFEELILAIPAEGAVLEDFANLFDFRFKNYQESPL